MTTTVKGRWSAPWIVVTCIALGAIPALMQAIFGRIDARVRDLGLRRFHLRVVDRHPLLGGHPARPLSSG